MPERKHNRIKELWYNRPWRYIPAVLGHMQRWPWSAVKRQHKLTFKGWLMHILGMHWYASYVHGKDAVYEKCDKCLCFDCPRGKCRKQNCATCDKLSRCYGEHNMITLICGKRGAVTKEDDIT